LRFVIPITNDHKSIKILAGDKKSASLLRPVRRVTKKIIRQA